LEKNLPSIRREGGCRGVDLRTQVTAAAWQLDLGMGSERNEKSQEGNKHKKTHRRGYLNQDKM
jgi:hypothetical protein